jgi:hypothetical protein
MHCGSVMIPRPCRPSKNQIRQSQGSGQATTPHKQKLSPPFHTRAHLTRSPLTATGGSGHRARPSSAPVLGPGRHSRGPTPSGASPLHSPQHQRHPHPHQHQHPEGPLITNGGVWCETLEDFQVSVHEAVYPLSPYLTQSLVQSCCLDQA